MKKMTTVRDIYIGKPDARDEIDFEGYENFIRSFVMPPNFDFEGLIKGNKCFIRGYKGTGKTALLYFLDTKIKEGNPSSCSSYIFFKNDYKSVQRQTLDSISRRIVSSIGIDKDILTNEQDFEYIWRWILYKRIIEDNEENNSGIFHEDENWLEFKTMINSILSEEVTGRLFNIPKKIKLEVGDLIDSVGNPIINPKIMLDFDKKDNLNEYSIFIH